jgi:segregation and condensation protein A
MSQDPPSNNPDKTVPAETVGEAEAPVESQAGPEGETGPDETGAAAASPPATDAADAGDAADTADTADRATGEAGKENDDSSLPESWKVHLPIFEGPLDLMLHLIKINKLDIYDIPVLLICDQFHEYLQLMEELNLDIAGEFIYEAALLIQLKSKMLLPKPKSQDGEPEEDPREELVQRLLEYRRLKEAAQSLAAVESVRAGIWTRQAGVPNLPGGDEEESVDLGDLSLFDLLRAMKSAIDRYHREHPPALHLRGETFSIRDQIQRLLNRMQGGRPYDFLDDLRLCSCRAEAVTAFLAILEMARMGLIRVHQTENREILLYRTTREITQAELDTLQH